MDDPWMIKWVKRIISECKWMKEGLCAVKSSFNWIVTAKSCKAFTSHAHTHTHTQMGVRKSRAVTQAYTRSDRQRKSLTEGYRVRGGGCNEGGVR